MEKNPFDDLRIKPEQVDNSIKWFRTQINNLSAARSLSIQSLMRQEDYLTKTLRPGRLYLYFYDPKFKDSLPYYDTVPLVYPYRKTSQGFIGYNLHYLPPVIRFKLMGVLTNIEMSTDLEKKKLAYTFGVLNSNEMNKYFAPCIKKYLSSHVKSRFLEIPYESWMHAALLPTESFMKASKNKVWKDSLGKV